jgi:phenylalanyl-tRNA synthetase alpha subunit
MISKLARKQDIEHKKKQKKVDWMRKMYKNGMLKAKGDDPEANAIIEQTTKELLDAFDQIGMENVDNWEVDELLNWTNALNFDEFVLFLNVW